MAGVNYRLSPRATHPAYIDDAAAAVAWVMKHIGEYGGDPTRVYVAGHSAGGYLTLMVGLDKAYLARYGEDADRLAGLFPVSGQTNTHLRFGRNGISRSIFLLSIAMHRLIGHVRGYLLW